MRDGASVVASLLQAGSELLGGGDREQPFEKRANGFRSVVKTLAESLIVTDDVANKIRFTDLDAEKESWSVAIGSSIFHGVLDLIGGHSKQLTAGESQAQPRERRSRRGFRLHHVAVLASELEQIVNRHSRCIIILQF